MIPYSLLLRVRVSIKRLKFQFLMMKKLKQNDGKSYVQKKLNELSRTRSAHPVASPTVIAQALILAHPIESHPPKQMNRVQTEGLRTVLDEKRLSTYEVINKYPNIMDWLKFPKFQMFTKPCGLYIPRQVRELYSDYIGLIPQKKMQVVSFKVIALYFSEAKI